MCYNGLMDATVITTTIITAISTIIVAGLNIWMNSQRHKDKIESRSIAEKNAAKSSIQNMITQDIIRTELLHKLPENRDDIESEFVKYTQNGGNGIIKKQYNEYLEWYKDQEARFSHEKY